MVTHHVEEIPVAFTHVLLLRRAGCLPLARLDQALIRAGPQRVLRPAAAAAKPTTGAGPARPAWALQASGRRRPGR